MSVLVAQACHQANLYGPGTLCPNLTCAPGMALDAALTSWLLTFAPDAPASATLRDFADGEVLLAVAQDVVDGFDFAAAPGGAAGALAALEAAFGVRLAARARA